MTSIREFNHSACFSFALGLICLLLSDITVAADNEPPTSPPNFTAVAVSSSEIRLSWEPSTDNRRVRNYQLQLNGEYLAIAKKTSLTVNSLQADTEYEFSIVANDGTNLSAPSNFTLSTLSAGETDDTGDGNSRPGNGKGRGKNDPDPTDPTDPPMGEGVPAGWQLVFNEDFTGTGGLDTSSTERNWRFETMSDGLHRAGNTGLDASGNRIADWDSVRGKRWSAWYNAHNDTNAYRENDLLVMGGLVSGEPDPTRPIDYVDDGVQTQYGSSKLYTSWIDTFARKWVGPGDLHVVDPDSPGKSFLYGHIEARVSFQRIMTPGFRFSIWLMPASTDAEGQDLVVSQAYDADGDNGVEIDLFEYEWINEDNQDRIHMALIGGAAGNSTESVDAGSLGFNLHEGFHTIALTWTADRLAWSINGVLVKEITDMALIPDVYSYLILSREMNSGVKRPGLDNMAPDDMVEEYPYIPRDPGLYAKNIWEFRDRIALDQALVDHVRIWQP